MPSHQETNYYLTQYYIPPYPSCIDLYSSMDEFKNGMLSLTKMVTLMASPSEVASPSCGVRMNISYKFPGGADTDGEQTTLWESQL